MCALTELQPGSSAIIERLDTSGAIGRRLLELGFVPGTRVSVIRRAPLGDPTVFELRGVRFCIRRSEASRITVRPDGREQGAA